MKAAFEPSASLVHLIRLDTCVVTSQQLMSCGLRLPADLMEHWYCHEEA